MTINRNLSLQWFTPCLCILWAANVLMAQAPLRDASPARAPTSQPGGNAIRQVEFKEVPLAEAVRMLGRQTGLNLVASQEAGKAKVSLFLQNVSASAVVEELCRANNLWYRQDEVTGIVRIMTVQEFQRDLTSFREEQTQVFAVLYPNAISTATAIQDLYGDRVQLSLGQDEEQDASRDINERLNRFDLIDQRSQGLGIYSAGGTSVAGGGQYGSGSQYGTTSGGTGSGYTSSTAARRPQGSQSPTAETNEGLRQLTPEQAEAISKALKEPNSQDQQAILDAFRKKQANIYVRVMRRNNLIVVRSSDQAAIQEISKLIQRLDVPTSTTKMCSIFSLRASPCETAHAERNMVAYLFTTSLMNPTSFSANCDR